MKAAGKLSEKAFMRQVVQFAQMCGYLVYHTNDSRNSEVGFPDLVMVRGAKCVVAELKVGTNVPTAAQRQWLAGLAGAGVAAYVWRPEDWPEIQTVLGSR